MKKRGRENKSAAIRIELLNRKIELKNFLIPDSNTYYL